MLLPLSGFGLDLDSWGIWRGFGLGAKGLVSAASASLLCHRCCMGWMSVLLKFCGRHWTLTLFLFSRNHLRNWAGVGDKAPNFWSEALTTAQIVWADYETSHCESWDCVCSWPGHQHLHLAPQAGERGCFLFTETEDLVGKLRLQCLQQ